MKIKITIIKLASVAQSNARPTGDQEVAGSILAGSGNVLFSWRLIIKYFYGYSGNVLFSWRLIIKYFYGYSFSSADPRMAVSGEKMCRSTG